jgi:hypothetical protein
MDTTKVNILLNGFKQNYIDPLLEKNLKMHNLLETNESLKKDINLRKEKMKIYEDSKFKHQEWLSLYDECKFTLSGGNSKKEEVKDYKFATEQAFKKFSEYIIDSKGNVPKALMKEQQEALKEVFELMKGICDE